MIPLEPMSELAVSTEVAIKKPPDTLVEVLVKTTPTVIRIRPVASILAMTTTTAWALDGLKIKIQNFQTTIILPDLRL